MDDKQQQPPRKNPCKDCSFCQLCNEAKCAMCRSPVNRKKDRKPKQHKPLFLKF